MSLSFVAIDFETANAFRGSPCAIGLVKVVGSKIVEEFSQLVRPPKGFDEFDPWNVAIHGITPEMVRGFRRFGEVWPEALHFIEDLPLVAHNAGFDVGVMREALTVSKLSWPELEYACTMVMGRSAYAIPAYTLHFVADAAGVSWDETQHHDARYDARAAAQIVLSMAISNESDSLDDLLVKLNVAIGKISSEMWAGCHSLKTWKHQNPKEIEINLYADSSHPVYGKHIVFTGTLHSMARAHAWKMVADLGGIPEAGVTNDTNVLVVGEQELSKLRPGQTQSAKFLKAAKLKSKGQDIEVMTERDFLSQLEPIEGRKTR